MKRKLLIRSGITLVVLFVLAFGIGVGQAYATTGCFTDTIGSWAETYICWMADNGITGGTAPGIYSPDANVSRAQMAVFMNKLDDVAVAQMNAADVTNLAAAKTYADTSDATNLTAAKAYTDASLSTGNILVSAGFGNWKPFSSTDPLSFVYFSGNTSVARSSIGGNYLSIQPDVPTVLYGRSLTLTGVEFCYAASASATLSYVEINTYTHSTGPGSRDQRFSDSTVRTDIACRLYTLATPVVLTAEMGVNFYVSVNWTVASANFALGRTTFVFVPTATIAAPPSAPQTFGTDQQTPLLPGSDSSAP